MMLEWEVEEVCFEEGCFFLCQDFFVAFVTSFDLVSRKFSRTHSLLSWFLEYWRVKRFWGARLEEDAVEGCAGGL